MTKMGTLKLTAVMTALGVLPGCAAVDTAQNVYSAARTGYTAKAAANDVKDIKAAEPAFAGYSSVLIYAQVSPRHEQNSSLVMDAFAQSMAYQVQMFAGAMGASLMVCRDPLQCLGRTVSIQFSEESYGANWAEKLTMGSQLKGKLTYVDNATGRVIAEKRIEGVDTYADALGLIRGSFAMSMLRSFGRGVSEEAMNRVPAVKPGFEKVLRTS